MMKQMSRRPLWPSFPGRGPWRIPSEEPRPRAGTPLAQIKIKGQRFAIPGGEGEAESRVNLDPGRGGRAPAPLPTEPRTSNTPLTSAKRSTAPPSHTTTVFVALEPGLPLSGSEEAPFLGVRGALAPIREPELLRPRSQGYLAHKKPTPPPSTTLGP